MMGMFWYGRSPSKFSILNTHIQVKLVGSRPPPSRRNYPYTDSAPSPLQEISRRIFSCEVNSRNLANYADPEI